MSAAQIKAAGVQVTTLSGVSASETANITLNGVVQIPNQLIGVISMPTTGVIQSIEINSHDSITKGQVIARIYSNALNELQREFQQHRSRTQLSAQKLKRDESLFAEGIIAASRLEETQSQHQQNLAEQEQRKQQLNSLGGNSSNTGGPNASAFGSNLLLRAHYAGAILEIKATPGQRLDAGDVIASFARAGQRWVELSATPQQALNIQTGNAVSIKGCAAKGSIAAIGRQINTNNQSLRIRADMPSDTQCLLPNQYVEAVVSANASTGSNLAIPSPAIVRNGSADYVFVQHPKGFTATPIQITARQGDTTLVRSGLKPGDAIAVKGVSLIKGAWQGLGTSEAEAKK